MEYKEIFPEYLGKEDTLNIAESLVNSLASATHVAKSDIAIEQGHGLSYWTCRKRGCAAEGRTFPVGSFLIDLPEKVDIFTKATIDFLRFDLTRDVKNALLQNWQLWIEKGHIQLLIEISYPNMLPEDWEKNWFAET